MATERRILITQLAQLYLTLRDYQQVQANPPYWMNTKALPLAIEQLEADISSLETQLDLLVANSSICVNGRV